MQLTWERISLTTRFPFAIARWGYTSHENVIVTITDDDGVVGMGEAAPNRYYGETVETVISALQRFVPLLAAADSSSLEALDTALVTTLTGNTSARAAVSAALHDLYGKRLGVPVYKLWGLDPVSLPISSYTIGIVDDDEELRFRLIEAAQYPLLKIKLGTPRDEAIIRVVRDAAPDKRIRVDANAAWTPKDAQRMTHVLHDYGVESVEQPVAARDLEGLRYVREHSPIPVIADESCLVAEDIPALANACDGINIKLAKCGSLREALRMVHVARAHHLRVMAGCMIETSLGISAIAQLAPLLNDADFDGAALLAYDPFDGATIPQGRVTLSNKPGLGVTRRTDTITAHKPQSTLTSSRVRASRAPRET